MRLVNRDTDYAIRAINYIAHSENKIISVSEIAKELEIPRPFLRKVLQRLNKKEVLNSYEGRGGGFSLTVPIDKIFLVDLINIFQGPVKLIECLFTKGTCPDARYCVLRGKIERIEDFVIKELKTLTVADLSYER